MPTFIDKVMQEFDEKFLSSIMSSSNKIRNEHIKSFLRSALTRQVEETVGKIGARLLAKHSPQAVLDAYFDAANEELKNNETNN